MVLFFWFTEINLLKLYKDKFVLYLENYTEHINHFALIKSRSFSVKHDVTHSFFFQLGIFAHPIYSISGDYPPEVRARVDNNSRAEGYQNSRLPYFTQEEVDYIRGQMSGYESK
jgi:hypothetical protein